MKKRVLIISPYFPPANAADMQRVRMSLPYFERYGWEAEVVTVEEKYVDILMDSMLQQSIPTDTKVHRVKAFNKQWTSKFGLGSLALRSLWFYRKKVNSLLKSARYDLIYFSTTQFPICILGIYWRKKFGMPYVIDMQDPWHSDYYRDKPKAQQPPKYWFSYRMNKYLERIAMPGVSGLISVSESYILDLKNRYPMIKSIPAMTLTFGAFPTDLFIAKKNEMFFKPILDPLSTNIVYVGRGGQDMYKAITPLFEVIKSGLAAEPAIFRQMKVYFIGTSYAPSGLGRNTIIPLAEKFGIESYVFEIPDRISYYHSLLTLQKADALFIPGSDDAKYTASKIFPYLLTGTSLLAVFHSQSSALNILAEYGSKYAFTFDTTADLQLKIFDFLTSVAAKTIDREKYNSDAINKYSAMNMTKRQCAFFNLVASGKN